LEHLQKDVGLVMSELDARHLYQCSAIICVLAFLFISCY